MLASTPQAVQPESPIDTALLSRMATALFAALPGEAPTLPASPVPGVQGPLHLAPPGSPLASPAGFGPGVPGTPIPQGQIPGSNLIPASPAQLPSLANRAPALLPHAAAGNGVPDTAVSVLPAYEPRLGGAALGVPEAAAAAQPPAGAAPYYFLGDRHGQPSAGGRDAGLDGLASLPFSQPGVPSVYGHTEAARTPEATPAEPKFYFVDSVVLPTGYVTPAKPAPHATVPLAGQSAHPAFDVHAVRRDFPILQERVNGRQLVWFDNAATTHKPQSVIDRISHFYEHENSNIHRAAHELAARSTDAYEGAREKVRAFLNASSANEIVFVRGATEGINLVAQSWGRQNIGAGDEIIVSHLEHHANIVPWQQLAELTGARLRVIPVDDDGQIMLTEYAKLLGPRTKLVSIAHVSNALGTIVPVAVVAAMAHAVGAKVLVDGAQAVSHMPVDVRAIDADWYVFSGHKVFAPTGIGVVYGKEALLNQTQPWQGGGNMIADVTFERTVYHNAPARFEAGTGNIADAVGLGAAIDYVNSIGMPAIAEYEHQLLLYATRLLKEIPGLRLIGTAPDKASVLSFVIDGFTTQDIGAALSKEGIAVRSGHHCAQPILRRFGVESSVRPSLAFYNDCADVDALIAVLYRLTSSRPSVPA